MSKLFRRSELLARAASILLLATLAACGASKSPTAVAPVPVAGTVAIAPSNPSVPVGGVTLAFSASIANATNSGVTWQVNSINGGNSSVGTISAAGIYQSPSVMPSSTSVTITAVSVADATVSGSESLTLTPAHATVSVSVSPSTASVRAGAGSQVFLATVENASDTAVSWQVNGVVGGNATVGTISTGGVYQAPATVPAQPTVSVMAVSVEDPTRSASASVTVTADTTPPPVSVSITPAAVSLQVGTGTQTFAAAVSNATNMAVTWKVNGVTGGNATVGTITSAGQYSAPAAVPNPAAVTVSAVSVADPTKSAAATVTLTAAPAAVSVAVTPTTANVAFGTGTQSFTATVSNSTNKAVTWQVNGVAGGSAASGTITTAGLYKAPTTLPSSLAVTVTAVAAADATKSGSATVTLTVAAPTISGTAGTTVMVGQAYDFKPTAVDPNGLPLTLSVTGKPAWLAFNTATGELSGTPAASDVGTSAIKITVSNTKATASLSFSLAVVQTASGSASLSWVAPTTHTDGSSMTDLAGFRIYYGTQQGSLGTRIDVTNPTVTTSVVPNLSSGTWYFAVTAVDSAGHESGYSNVASKTI